MYGSNRKYNRSDISRRHHHRRRRPSSIPKVY